MKLVIHTQIRENYAAHNGFNGEYRWKYKGGNTYIVENLSPAQAMKAKKGIPTLTKLVTDMNDYFEEYVLDWSLEDDDVAVCEPWETPTFFSWGGDRWLATKHTLNGEYGYMNRNILAKREEWIPLESGERADYKVEYDLGDQGGWCSHDEAMKHLEAA